MATNFRVTINKITFIRRLGIPKIEWTIASPISIC